MTYLKPPTSRQVIHHLSPGDHTQATAPAQVKASRLQKSGGNHEEFTNHRVAMAMVAMAMGLAIPGRVFVVCKPGTISTVINWLIN